MGLGRSFRILLTPLTYILVGNIVKPPQKRVLPDILSVSEVERVINGTRELRYQTFLFTAYSMGLRLGEALQLEVGDIDSARGKVHIRQGKGRKDRFVLLPGASLDALRRYWATHRHPSLIFPTGRTTALRREATQVMDRSGLQKAFKVIVRSCGVNKRVTIHSLRHCYGAHLVEMGLNLRAIQQEMGHECPKTTALYTQLTDVTHQNTGRMINRLVNRLQLNLDGEVLLACHACAWQTKCYQSCGHRSCNQCQNHCTTQWLERQKAKLLPVAYFMVTFA